MGKNIERVATAKDLGVYINNTLNYNDYINKIGNSCTVNVVDNLVNNVIKQLVRALACVCRDIEHAGSLESTKEAQQLHEAQPSATLAS